MAEFMLPAAAESGALPFCRAAHRPASGRVPEAKQGLGRSLGAIRADAAEQPGQVF